MGQKLLFASYLPKDKEARDMVRDQTQDPVLPAY